MRRLDKFCHFSKKTLDRGPLLSNFTSFFLTSLRLFSLKDTCLYPTSLQPLALQIPALLLKPRSVQHKELQVQYVLS